MDNKILTTLIKNFKGGPVGITTLSTAVSETAETIEEVYEPFLIQQGFIVRTPRGRQVTDKAYKHLGLTPLSDQKTFLVRYCHLLIQIRSLLNLLQKI